MSDEEVKALDRVQGTSNCSLEIGERMFNPMNERGQLGRRFGLHIRRGSHVGEVVDEVEVRAFRDPGESRMDPNPKLERAHEG